MEDGGETSGTRMAFAAAIAAEKTDPPFLAVLFQLPLRQKSIFF